MKKSIPAISGLVFQFVDFLRECIVIKDLTNEVLDHKTDHVLDDARTLLENIQRNAPTDRTTTWTIPREVPLLTAWSRGESKPDKKAEHTLRAQMSFVWQIRPIQENGHGPRRSFALEGKASTEISLVDEAGQCFAIWQFDVGDPVSPGTHFHIHSQTSEGAGLQKILDVPRFPSAFMSPFQAFEFAVAEIFQDRWRKYSSTNVKQISAWNGIQKPRYQNFLRWQLATLDSSIPPLMALKLAKPSADLFVQKT